MPKLGRQSAKITRAMASQPRSPNPAVGPYPAGIIHHKIQPAQPGDCAADTGCQIFIARHIDARRIGGSRVFAHRAQIQPGPGMIKKPGYQQRNGDRKVNKKPIR